MTPGKPTMDPCELVKTSDASLKALGIMLDAWDEAADAGITAELMAYAALFTALTDLVAAHGEEAVAQVMRGLVSRINGGEFTAARTLQ